MATRRKTKEVVEEGKLKGVPSNLINALVDEGYRLTTEIKELEKRLTEIKETLKLQDGVLEGVDAVASISQTKEWEVSPTVLNNWMKKHRKTDLFDAVLRANITNIKKYLGEYTMAEFARQVDGGKRISFKKKEG